MSATHRENQPAQDASVSRAIWTPVSLLADNEPQHDDLDERSEDAIPDVKSGVRVDPNAAPVRDSHGFEDGLLF